MPERNEDEDIDRAYRAAAPRDEDAAAADTTAARRRKSAVLAAVRALAADHADGDVPMGSVITRDPEGRTLQPDHTAGGEASSLAEGARALAVPALATDSPQGDAGANRVSTGVSTAQPPAPSRHDAANQPWWNASSAGWRGAAAACVIASSALVVIHLRDEPDAQVRPPQETMRGEAAPAKPTERGRAAAPSAAAPTASALAESPADMTQDKLATVAPSPSPSPSPSASAAAAAPAASRPAEPAPGNTKGAEAGRADTASAHSLRRNRAQAQAQAASVMAPPPAARSQVQSAPDAAPMVREPPPATALAERRTQAAPAAGPAAFGGSAAKPWSDRAARSPAATIATPPPPTLLAAAASGDLEAARTILETTGPDGVTDPDGRTALALAVLRADPPMIRLLIEKGANRLARDRLGQTPIGYARASGDAAVIGALDDK